MIVVHSESGTGVFTPYASRNKWRLLIRRDGAENSDLSASGFGRLQPPSDDDIKSIITNLVPGTQVESVGWRSAYSTDTRIVTQMVKERGILIGDAARLQPPSWGAGLNSAISVSSACAMHMGVSLLSPLCVYLS